MFLSRVTNDVDTVSSALQQKPLSVLSMLFWASRWRPGDDVLYIQPVMALISMNS